MNIYTKLSDSLLQFESVYSHHDKKTEVSNVVMIGRGIALLEVLIGYSGNPLKWSVKLYIPASLMRTIIIPMNYRCYGR